MGDKKKELEDSPMLFMDWPNITLGEGEIVLKSSITKVKISDKGGDQKDISSEIPPPLGK
jgi:hypothetical protein